MCVHNFKKAPRKTGFGYKVFNVKDGQLFSEIFEMYEPRPPRTWLRASELKGKKTPRYGAGFHVFTTLKDARDWHSYCPYQVIRRVRYRKASVVGDQFGFSSAGPFSVVVAKEIFILRGAK